MKLAHILRQTAFNEQMNPYSRFNQSMLSPVSPVELMFRAADKLEVQELEIARLSNLLAEKEKNVFHHPV